MASAVTAAMATVQDGKDGPYPLCQRIASMVLEVHIMATVTVRNFSERSHRELKARAARNGRSMEAEIRVVIEQALRSGEPADAGVRPVPGLGDRIRARFEGLGLPDPLPKRADEARAAVFES